MSRYAAVHKDTKGPGDARPTAAQIVQDEGLVGKLGGKQIVVTGVSSGIGIETVRALHMTGASIIGTVRNLSKGQTVVDEILSSSADNKAPIELVHMEMDSFESVEKGAKEILQKTGGKINILINNAGVRVVPSRSFTASSSTIANGAEQIMAVPYRLSKDGYESQFATNHLGHFLLFQLLKDALLSAAAPDFPSRVVSVSSMGHRYGQVNFDDFNMTNNYEPNAAYGQSKTANVYFASELERRYGGRNLHSTSLHPGGIITGLQTHLKEQIDQALQLDYVAKYMKNPEQGAATTVYAAVSKEWADKGGRFLSDCIEQGPVQDDSKIVGDDGHAPWAYDQAKEATLWKESLRILGLQDDQ